MIRPKYVHRITVVDKNHNIQFKGDDHYESRIKLYVFRIACARVNNYYYVNTLL